MSGRVCFIERRGAGDQIASIRLLGPRGQEAFEPAGPAADSTGAIGRTGEAAAWIAAKAGRAGVSLLVLDVGGGECRWVTAPGMEPDVVAAAMAQAEDWGDGGRASSGGWAAATTSDRSVQALADIGQEAAGNGLTRRRTPAGEDAAVGHRVGALAIPDISARLLVDALDERGVAVERAVSLWHAMSLAWDPPAPVVEQNENVVASSAPVTAVILIEGAGRAVWCWSRAGELLAAGTLRLPLRQGDRVHAGKPEIGRLSADWLAWSVQLGVAPARIVAVSPSLDGDGGGLSAGDLGTELGKLWPGTTIDLAIHDDPIGATLQRLTDTEEHSEQLAVQDGRRGLVTLSARPGRAHRQMYRWAALTLAIACIALAAIAWKAWDSARDAGSAQRQARDAMMAVATDVAPPASVTDQATVDGDPRLYLEQRLQQRRREIDPTGGIEPAKPIMSELDALSYILGNAEIRLRNLNMDTAAVILTVEVPDTRTGEDLIATMDSIAGSNIAEWRRDWGGAGSNGRPTLTLQGRWASTRPAPAGGQP